MSINLLEAVQIQMGYPSLQKIDPNKQEPAANLSTPDGHRFGQAAIPGVLTALYRYSRTDEGVKNILGGTNYTDWIDLIFADKKQNAVQRIAFYSYYSMQNAELKMNAIAAFSVRIIKETLPAESSIPDVKKFIAGQRSNILPYLPAVLQMGELLYDNTLDDRTHKMEGPVSIMGNIIGDRFSEGELEN
ncbi:MAG TPA: hypothetical protein VFX58_11105 [Chitinophagaceae bacterium]|nr:hypothetical protein [Chitinophagaceae bacterium]